MRVSEIRTIRERVRAVHEPLPVLPPAPYSLDNFQSANRPNWKRRILDRLAPIVLPALQKQFRTRLGMELEIPCDLVCVGERWAFAAAWSRFAPSIRGRSVLVEGCGVGDGTVQQCLRAGAASVCGIELMNLDAIWESTVPQLRSAFSAEVEFRRASVDSIPYGDARFDAIASGAVYEHVYNLDSAAAEAARVLKPGGLAFHSVGPLFYGFSGDHCISEYGDDAGYDHVLLSEAEYRNRVNDDAYYAKTADPHAAFWAKTDKLSFAAPAEYFEAFAAHFAVDFVVVIVDPNALLFRERRPDRWEAMLAEGLTETDLLVKSFHAILRKK